jgi:hypothetical protein
MAPAIVPHFMDKVGLIDADYIKYHVIHNYNPNKTVPELTEEAIGALRDKFTSSNMLFCFTGSNNFRDHIAFEKKYKGTRKLSDNEEHTSNLKLKVVEYVGERYPSLLYDDLEADDLLSMLQDEDTFIYSEDKDLKQVPGTHWDIKKGEFYKISKDDALKFLMKQMIEGDTVDNITGLKGYGPASCKTLLTNIETKDLPIEILNEYMLVHGVVNGIDSFVENWNLLKLRGKRGVYLMQKYIHAFNMLDMLK